MIAINDANDCIVSDDVKFADTFSSRLKGLTFRDKMEGKEGLVLFPCNMIHTFGMHFSIDVVYLSKDNTVLRLIENLRPNRIAPIVPKAHSVMEVPAGILKATDTRKGDHINFRQIIEK